MRRRADATSATLRLGGAEPGFGAVSHRLSKAVAGGTPSVLAVYASEPPPAPPHDHLPYLACGVIS